LKLNLTQGQRLAKKSRLRRALKGALRAEGPNPGPLCCFTPGGGSDAPCRPRVCKCNPRRMEYGWPSARIDVCMYFAGCGWSWQGSWCPPPGHMRDMPHASLSLNRGYNALRAGSRNHPRPPSLPSAIRRLPKCGLLISAERATYGRLEIRRAPRPGAAAWRQAGACGR